MTTATIIRNRRGNLNIAEAMSWEADEAEHVDHLELGIDDDLSLVTMTPDEAFIVYTTHCAAWIAPILRPTQTVTAMLSEQDCRKNGKQIVSQYDGADVYGRPFTAGTQIYYRNNKQMVIA